MPVVAGVRLLWEEEEIRVALKEGAAVSQKFTPEGNLLAIWDPNDFDLAYPSGVTVGPEGMIGIARSHGSLLTSRQSSAEQCSTEAERCTSSWAHFSASSR